MLLKSKIFFTSVVIYEILAVSFLHFQKLCDTVFSSEFCVSWYRYFLFCVVIPLIAFIICMWIHEAIHAHRRHKFIRRAKSAFARILSGGRISRPMTSKELETIIIIAVLITIKQFINRYPNLRKNVNNIMNLANGEIDIDLISTDDETPKKQTRTKVQKNTKRKRTK